MTDGGDDFSLKHVQRVVEIRLFFLRVVSISFFSSIVNSVWVHGGWYVFSVSIVWWVKNGIVNNGSDRCLRRFMCLSPCHVVMSSCPLSYCHLLVVK